MPDEFFLKCGYRRRAHDVRTHMRAGIHIKAFEQPGSKILPHIAKCRRTTTTCPECLHKSMKMTSCQLCKGKGTVPYEPVPS